MCLCWQLWADEEVVSLFIATPASHESTIEYYFVTFN